ncbi:MAG: histidine--tRNA ligase [Candidatus Portnoybacteria bacterium CG10_big_fil_rev_8_21_14_0_10_36_7]|uniref:Histidine--tRNA ligase n=1 Tax=Candidatus Portnoybacteria bacterium CG10_big_fil_rev_8_21_14_0_10_36_7 TaxID=1974812 RepID=A0A2M8KE90_9BACT|nr:MAG: histidine--tRNA ligase [Candidatus Portnoybacteria bacterium CG10_big_fil_rev_8_21_14_0_10_36_7]
MASKSFQSPKGMPDILPQDQAYWEKVRKIVKDLSGIYGFSRIDTPIVEDTALFERGTGEATEVVSKQMYSFKTKGGYNLTLRPEGTPSIARAYIQHGMINLPHPLKLYYIGPFFRHEQPQSGRFRQFHQFGFEIIGEKSPVLDAQIIQIFLTICENLGLKNLSIHLNSIGCPSCRPEYRKVLKDWLGAKSKKLCLDCRVRIKKNPLRVLDCKDEKCKQMINGAPNIIDYLCSDCKTHFKKLLEFLDELEIPYFISPFLVRGLDYYTKTVFEVFSDAGEEDPVALGGGGRYDVLISDLGGKDTSAVGAAFGIERLVNLMKKQQVKLSQRPAPKVFLVHLGDLGKVKSLKLFNDLYRAGIIAGEAFGKDSIKSQFKIADRIGAKFSLILGQQEALDNAVILRDMESGVQEVIPLPNIAVEVKKRLRKVVIKK